MILILAELTDPWAISLHRQVGRLGQSVCWIPPAQLLDRVLLNWPVISGSSVLPGSLVVDGLSIPLAHFTGIFAWLSLPPPLELEDLSSQDRDYVIKETSAAWLALLNAMPCSVVNRPVPGGRPTLIAGNPHMTRLAQQYGLLLPPSLCTSSRADAILQFSAWSKRVYLKVQGSHEPGMILRSHDGVEEIALVMEQHAISMQAIPRGQRITVYVVGDQAVATIVHANEHSDQSVELPSLPTQQCIDLVGALGLTFAECHFIVTPEGQIYCLDVSSAPSYWHCPREIQEQIVCRLAVFLSEQRSLPFHDSLAGADSRSGARQRVCTAGNPER